VCVTLAKAKHRQIFDRLHQMIVTGQYRAGQKLPTEAELAEAYQVSRPTAGQAVKELERLGLVERRVGSGTYIRAPQAQTARQFALLIPELEETEIFGPIARQIAREVQERQDVLLWGESSGARPGDGANGKGTERQQAVQLCQRYVELRVSGVFFAPLELAGEQEAVNREIVAEFAQAGIPLVLLDRDTVPYPQRSGHDLVNIDHRRGGYVLAHHLLKLGVDRVDFVARPHSAPSVALRIAGYQEALWRAGIVPRGEWVHVGDPEDGTFVHELVAGQGARAIICGNDVTAGQFMHQLDLLGYRVPGDVRVVGFDDVKYAKLLRVPLTTVRQPCEALGTLAAQAMYERIRHPQLPAREILVTASLVVRKSCGGSGESNSRIDERS
jgi:GntR family transcriptional regulator, arabinose operon transcriptional repressor